MLTIMITAYASLETAVTATKRGAWDFLAKPFTPEELKNTVRKAASRLILTRQARKLADEKRKVRFQFISVLAHELKSPLAAIEGYLHLIKDHTAGESVIAYDQIIDRSLVRLDGMRKMIVDLLDMTCIESGEKQRDLTEVDIVAAARRAIDANIPEARSRGITITLHTPTPCFMTADSGELDIILNNLVSNAVKYNRDNGRVDIRITRGVAPTYAIHMGLPQLVPCTSRGPLLGTPREDERVTLSVSDTGIGLTPDEAGRLFNDFVRIKNEKTKHILGSGLGLSIVKKLAQLYGGEVSVTSTPDEGSIFTVRLGNPSR
jgi:signal transduction histidine kinase